VSILQKGNRSPIFNGSDNNKESTRSKRQVIISRVDYIISHINKLRFYLRNFFLIRKAYVNYISVIMAIRKNQYPIQAILRSNNSIPDGGSVLISSLNELLLLAHLKDHKGLDYDLNKGLLTINLDFVSPGSFFYNSKENKLTLHGCGNNGDIISVFIENKYSFLPVEGKTVIDIGTNIADSTIYFCLKGAARVIGLEPFPHNYVIAKKNIESNKMSTKVSLLLAGLGPNIENISISPEYSSDHKSQARDFGEGIQVPILTLADIINKYNVSLQDTVLKMDCEGCEYESVFSAPRDVLRSFDHIQIEYHSGYKNLKEKLEECGFKVSVERPLAGRENSNIYLGFIYATRKN
jgi:FkbM family methyltransferase